MAEGMIDESEAEVDRTADRTVIWKLREAANNKYN